MERRVSRARQNALRSGLVVLGSIAFGYLSLQIGFKPYLERAREAAEVSATDSVPGSDKQQSDQEFDASFVQEEGRKYKDTVLE